MTLTCALSLFTGLKAWAAPPYAPYEQAVNEFRSGKFQAASATLESNVKRPSADSELLLARCYYELGEWDRAILHAQSAVHLNASSATNHVLLGEAYGRKAESERSLSLAVKTRHEFEKAVALEPNNIDARRDLLQFYLEAPWVIGGGKERARREAAAIASLDPVEGALARARIDDQAGQMGEAREEYNRTLALRPAKLGPYLEAADFYVKTKDVAGLNAALREAESVNAADVRLDYYRGVARVLEGERLTQAEHDLKSYVSNSPPRHDYPSHASALSWLGKLYERLGKPNLAVIEYEAALELNPNMFGAREALERLKTSGK